MKLPFDSLQQIFLQFLHQLIHLRSRCNICRHSTFSLFDDTFCISNCQLWIALLQKNFTLFLIFLQFLSLIFLSITIQFPYKSCPYRVIPCNLPNAYKALLNHQWPFPHQMYCTVSAGRLFWYCMIGLSLQSR